MMLRLEANCSTCLTLKYQFAAHFSLLQKIKLEAFNKNKGQKYIRGGDRNDTVC